MSTLDQLSYVAKVEEECHAAFETEFHKVRATMTYDQWRLAFKIGWRRGREDAQRDWADHMTRMADASRTCGTDPATRSTGAQHE